VTRRFDDPETDEPPYGSSGLEDSQESETSEPSDFSGINDFESDAFATPLRRLVATGAVFAFLAIVGLPLLAFSLPAVLARDNGLEQFTGEERVAAEYALEQAAHYCPDHPLEVLAICGCESSPYSVCRPIRHRSSRTPC
jgi:hypothetical protein